MNIIRWGEKGASETLSKLEGLREFSAGAQTPTSISRTKDIFGEELTAGEVVERIIRDVREKGDAALFEYTRLLDGVEVSSANLRVSAGKIQRAKKEVPKEFLQALGEAKKNISSFYQGFSPPEPRVYEKEGKRIIEKCFPLRRVGIYIPGGKAAYPSTVLMSVIPARAAGVKEMAIATPPREDGRASPLVLAAAELLDINEIYAMGGAQAIAALAFGTETVKKVDKIVGPGNIFVTLAKRAVFGWVDIDMLAGPSEILVLADESAEASVVALDLAAQVEHSPGIAILVTSSANLAQAVQDSLEKLGEDLKQALEKYGLIIVTKGLDEAASLAERIAPEHLEIICRGAEEIAEGIRNAGAIFVGASAPVAAGDYSAGPSHILPTSGSARFSSALSPQDFMRRAHIISYMQEALEKDAPIIETLAEAEGLKLHAESVRRRRGQNPRAQSEQTSE
jgi:histidinol dehydrogenase